MNVHFLILRIGHWERYSFDCLEHWNNCSCHKSELWSWLHNVSILNHNVLAFLFDVSCSKPKSPKDPLKHSGQSCRYFLSRYPCFCLCSTNYWHKLSFFGFIGHYMLWEKSMRGCSLYFWFAYMELPSQNGMKKKRQKRKSHPCMGCSDGWTN